ncbi:MAG: hypothetical protein OES34_02070 [Nitrosopumilus sp.]|nr:hypothetical protein [Nitrosopumilus sp.]
MTLQKRSHGYKVVEDVLQGMGASSLMPDGSILGVKENFKIVSLNSKIIFGYCWD